MQKLGSGEYGSIIMFIDSVNSGLAHPANGNIRDDYARTRDRGGWYGAGCHTGDAVQKLVREGWREGRERMEALRSQIAAVEQPIDRKRRRVRADMGDELDIHMAYAGRFDIAWLVPKRIRSAGPVRLDIAANMICSGGDHPDVLFWRGAAAAVLADILEQSGYMVRLTVIFGGMCSGKKVSCRITVKDHGAPLDNASIASATLPGFFRALGHAWTAAHHPDAIESPSMSVGIGNVEPGEILLSHTVQDHGTAVAFINDTIAKLNAAHDVVAA